MGTDHETWIRNIRKKYGTEYTYAVCPYLENNACGIYERRFNCCRNYPQLKGFCAHSATCALTRYRSKETATILKEICARCGNNCCRRIVVPKGMKITKKFIERWMNIDCQTCRKIF